MFEYARFSHCSRTSSLFDVLVAGRPASNPEFSLPALIWNKLIPEISEVLNVFWEQCHVPQRSAIRTKRL